MNRVIDLSRKAVAADEAKNYEEALGFYRQVAKILLQEAKEEKSERVRGMLRGRAEEYIQRAEVLHHHLYPEGVETTCSYTNSASQPGRPATPRPGSSQVPRGSMDGAIVHDRPNVPWTDVIGHRQAKQALQEAVVLPIQVPELFRDLPPAAHGLVLHGPPGTGKTQLARAAATECKNVTFFAVSASTIVSKWMGDSEKMVRELFESARSRAPSIIFIDEVDSVCSKRHDDEQEGVRRFKTEFLTQMDGIGSGNALVVVVGATNRLNDLDEAFLRRCQNKIFIGLPDEEDREAILRMKMRGVFHSLSDEDFRWVAQQTDKQSGSVLHNLCHDACMGPIRAIQTSEWWVKTEDGGWMPCAKEMDGAVQKQWSDLPSKELRKPPVIKEDFEHAIKSLS